MQRVLLALVILLVGLLLARDPRVEKADYFFLRWLLRNTAPAGDPVPLTVVEIGREPLLPAQSQQKSDDSVPGFIRGTSSGASALEFALFLQSVLDYKPVVVAIEPVIQWRERDRDQEQVFLDQAMRVPKLVLGAELTATPDPDLPVAEISAFPHVSGARGDLPSFSGVAHQPNEDMRLISTPGYINLPDEIFNENRAPLLFQYHGDVIPGFALQAFLAWARVPLSAVTIKLGSYIELPRGRRIPIRSDGSLLVNPNVLVHARRMRLNELLLLAQQRSAGNHSPLESLHDDLVLARTPLNPLAPPDVFAATIATLQSNRFIRRISIIFDCVVLLLVVSLSWPATRMSRVDLILGTMVLGAGYCLVAFALLSRFGLWVPGVTPLGALVLLLVVALTWPRPERRAEVSGVSSPPSAS